MYTTPTAARPAGGAGATPDTNDALFLEATLLAEEHYARGGAVQPVMSYTQQGPQLCTAWQVPPGNTSGWRPSMAGAGAACMASVQQLVGPQPQLSCPAGPPSLRGLFQKQQPQPGGQAPGACQPAVAGLQGTELGLQPAGQQPDFAGPPTLTNHHQPPYFPSEQVAVQRSGGQQQWRGRSNASRPMPATAVLRGPSPITQQAPPLPSQQQQQPYPWLPRQQELRVGPPARPGGPCHADAATDAEAMQGEDQLQQSHGWQGQAPGVSAGWQQAGPSGQQQQQPQAPQWHEAERPPLEHAQELADPFVAQPGQGGPLHGCRGRQSRGLRPAGVEQGRAAGSSNPLEGEDMWGSADCAEEEQAEAVGEGDAEQAGPVGECSAQPAVEAEQPKRKMWQLFDFLCVYDLEATCDAAKKLQPQEIIELSCVVVNTRTMRLEGRFQQYVRPSVHPRLTDFCTSLTAITQQQVDAGISLEATLEKHTTWLREQGLLGQGKTFVPVTWNDWDFKIMMDSELKWRKLQKPKYMARWVDLKAVFIKHYRQRMNLRSSVEHAGLEWVGRAHSAIDDASNTARLAVKLMQRGVVLGITGSFTGVDASGKFKQSTLFGDGRAPAKKAKKVLDNQGKWTGQCSCGVKARKRTVKRPGPTNGKEFWSCGKYTVTGGASCEFFMWCEWA